MQGFVCVYRRYVPSNAEFRDTRQASEADSQLSKFLDEYYRDDRYFDWGDDPSFFCAQHLLGDTRRASWGVCRPNVRAQLRQGDFVAFFCAKPDRSTSKKVEYFFVGVGTVRDAVDRRRIWADPAFARYRHFYNILAKPCAGGGFSQYETFHPYHQDWQSRLAHYIVFDPSLSEFNLRYPPLVATYSGRVPERWRSDFAPEIRRLEELLFVERGISRRLRTSRAGFSHPAINLAKARGRPRRGRPLEQVRNALLKITRTAAQHGAADARRGPRSDQPW